ncbi:MAG: tandem-95 repeat protein [Candidatus Delongbacteria bacterium]|nr:tandem-95 repeat protein [Candidatus Delongbacteria bacterium]MBN2835863.1 tandem-95 repeat protein [Candidatus Delongbacteria bacterium]
MQKIIIFLAMVFLISCEKYPYETKNPTLLKHLGDLSLNEDFGEKIFELNEYFAYSSELTYTISDQSLTSCNAKIENENLIVSSLDNKFGENSITISATSSVGNRTTDILHIVINAVNDIPTLTQIPDVSIMENESFEPIMMDNLVRDVDDNDSLIVWSVEDDENLIFNFDQDRILRISRKEATWFGSELVKIIATDASGASAHMYGKFSVVEIDLPIVINSYSPSNTSPVLMFEGETKVFDVSANDPNGNELSFIFKLDNEIVSYNSNFTYSPDENSAGTHVITVDIDDGATKSTEHIVWQVEVANQNQGPVVYANIPDITKTEDFDQFTINLLNYFNDPDGDSFIYETVYDDAEISLSISGDFLIIDAVPNWNGTAFISVKAIETNPEQLFVVDQFNVTITPENDPPSFSFTITSIEMLEDTPLQISFEDYITDIDGDELQISIVENNNFTLQQFDNYLITLTPIENFNGSENVFFKVFDGEFSATDNITINVSSVNDAPVLTLPEVPFELNEDTPIEISFDEYIFDEEGDNIIITLVNNSDFTFEQLSNYIVRLTPALNYNGSVNVTFEISDGNLTDEDDATINTLAVDDAPVLDPVPSQTIATGESFTLISLNDYLHEFDGDDVVFTTSTGVNLTLTVNSSNELTIGYEASWIGSETITITVTDQTSSLLSDSVDVVFEVEVP